MQRTLHHSSELHELIADHWQAQLSVERTHNLAKVDSMSPLQPMCHLQQAVCDLEQYNASLVEQAALT